MINKVGFLRHSSKCCFILPFRLNLKTNTNLRKLCSQANIIPKINGTTDYPVIPKIKTLINYEPRQPHSATERLIADQLAWCQSVARRSAPDQNVRETLSQESRLNFFETASIYISLCAGSTKSYQQLFEVTKIVTWAAVIDDFFDSGLMDIDGQVRDYMTRALADDFVYQPADDGKRIFWSNLFGSAVTGLRRAGFNRSQLHRLVFECIRFYELCNKPAPYFNDDNYWPFKILFALTHIIYMPLEALAGIDVSGRPDLLKIGNIDEAFLLSEKIICLANDLLSYFREKNYSEIKINRIAYLAERSTLTEQEAVFRVSRETIDCWNRYQQIIKQFKKTDACHQDAQLATFVHHVLDNFLNGLLHAQDILARHRLNYGQRNGFRPEEIRFVNETTGNCTSEQRRHYDNVWRQFEQTIAK